MSEPAVVSYFFGPGYRHLREVVGEAWEKASEVAASLGSQASGSMPVSHNTKDPESWLKIIVAASYGTASALAYVVSGICLALLASIHALVLATGTVIAFSTAVVLRSADAVWRRIWQIGHPCPSCYERGRVPVYLCPKCGAHHSCLTPSKYGVLRRFCECGANLPVLDALGRTALECQCANCSQPLANLQTTDLHVAFVGGPSSGKTSLFLMQF